MADPTYIDVLGSAGYPTDVLVLDFESYYDTAYSLKKMSTVEYITDPQYEVLGLATLRQKPYRPPAVAAFDHDIRAMLEWCQVEYGLNLEGCTVLIQNARFDGMILAMKYGIYPPYCVDLLGLARALYPGHRNDLDSICERENLPAKGDTNEFKGYGWVARLGPPGPKPKTFTRKKDKREFREIHPGVFQETIRRGMSDAMRSSLADYARNDATQEFAAFKRYLPRFSRPEVELRVMQQTLELFWKPSIRIDFEVGEELATAMEAKVVEAAESVELTPEIIRSHKFHAILQEALGDDPLPMKQGTNGSIPALAKEDEGRAYLLVHPDPRIRALMEALIAVKSWPLHSARVRRIMAQALACDGFLAVALKYMGAHTGRWSGDERINVQNLSKRTQIALLLRIRSLLIAPVGHKLASTDASQIEARILAWIAEQEDLIQAFADGEPIYCQFASEVLGKPVRKTRKDDPPFVQTTMTRYRDMGKVGVLGCFEKNTLVLTDHGWVSIIAVKPTDKVWDGETWVTTTGPIYQGEKSTIRWRGIGVTPDHLILTREGWVSVSQVQSDVTRYLKSVKSVVNLESSGMWSVLAAELRRWKLYVWNAVATSIRWICTTFGGVKAPVAMSVQNELRTAGERNIGATQKSYPTMPIEPDCSIEYRPYSNGVQIQRPRPTKTTVAEESPSTMDGLTIEPKCSGILSRWRVGIIRFWTWIGSTMSRGISRAIYGSVHGRQTSQIDGPSLTYRKKSPTYDLGLCGPNNRFTILTTAGPLIVHNCGYGMGVGRCYDFARQVYHVDITEEQARTIVKHYRAKNDRIVAFWGELEGAAKYVTRYPHETIELSKGRLRLRNDGGTMVIVLPCGRELYYHGMRITVMNKPGFTRSVEQLRYPDPMKPGVFNNVWGGLLTENCVQAMARDVLAESMLLADEWGQEIGMRVGLHVHDEMLSVVPEEHAERGLEIQIAALETVPSWAEGCPLTAEGAIKDRWYDK